jgi:hypothetical protein
MRLATQARQHLGVAGFAISILSALSAATLLGLLFSGHLPNPTYESFVNRQDTILRAISFVSISSLLAIAIAAFGFGQKRIVAVVVSFMTLILMTWLFFIIAMARF